MRMRGLRVDWIWLLAICCFHALFVYLYLFHYLFNQNHKAIINSQRPVDSRVIEVRLVSLEQELNDNRLLTQQIRQQIGQYLTEWRQNQQNGDRFDNSFNCKIDTLEQNLNVDLTVENICDEIEFDNPDGGVWKHGWPIFINQSRFTSNNPLQVIVVPHSHNDPGWLKTFEQYYVTQTKFILNNMLTHLTRNSKASFIWAEVSFFAMWYESLTSEDAKESIKLLLEKGQLEFVTGGWVMNDEANTNYFAIISQMVEGHEWLLHHLNYRPKNGWAIDPFGLSPTMAFLLKRMGLSGMVVQRVHYAIKKYLAKRTMLEFKWRQSWETGHSLSINNDILCHVMPFYSYDVPHTCGPDPKVCCQFDFKRLNNARMACPWKAPPQRINSANIKERAELLLDQYRKKAMLFRTNVLLVPLGDDFRYDKSIEWINQLENYEKIFNYINSDSSYNTKLKFGTLSDYFDLLAKSQIEMPSISGDFFTYADRDDNYWSGYYTSRPFYKRFDRIFEFHLRAAEILFSFYSINNGGRSNLLQQLSPLLTNARRNLALFQHHDGITGTAKDHVVRDYGNKMLIGIKNCQHIMASIINSLFYLPMNYPTLSVNITQKYQSNLPQVNIPFKLDQNSKKWVLLIYNSLAKEIEDVICVDIINPNNNFWILRDFHGKLVTDVQINTMVHSKSNDTYEACFMVNLPPISITQYTMEISDFNPHYERSVKTLITNFNDNQINPMDEFVIKSDRIKLTFGRTDGLLRSISYSNGNIQINNFKLRLDFVFYGTKMKKNSAHSGAYLFIPDEDEPQDVPFKNVQVTLIEGPLVSRVHIYLGGDIQIEHTLSITKGQPFVDVRNVFLLKRGLFNNKELLMRLYSGIKNDGIFYTDLNSLQMARREYREKIPLQGNVFPMPSTVYLQDNVHRLTVLSAQPLGVTSHFGGNLDIFLDRLMLKDDQRGLGQGITDNKITQESFRILIEPMSQDAFKPSLDAQTCLLTMLNPPMLMNSRIQSNQGQIRFLRNELPCDVHLLNLRTNLYANDEYHAFFHRFASTCETRCDQSTFNVYDLFNSNIGDLFDRQAIRQTLSLMYSKGAWNLTSDLVNLDSGDFEVITLRLKN